MGNKDSKSEISPRVGTAQSARDPRLVQFWKRLVPDGKVEATETAFEEQFGHQLGRLLFGFLSKNSKSRNGLSEDDFHSGVSRLCGTSTDPYIQMFFTHSETLDTEELRNVIQMARATAKIHFLTSVETNVKSEDDRFLDSVVDSVILCGGSDGVTFSALKHWLEVYCPRLLSGLQKTVISRLTNQQSELTELSLSSDVLSSFQLWFVQCCLPICYVSSSSTQKTGAVSLDVGTVPTSVSWDKLYCSSEHGLSASRFENKVMGYRGPTVLFTTLVDGSKYCIAVDEEWRFGIQRWGKESCKIIELIPSLKIVSEGAQTMYFNAKTRGHPLALMVGTNPKNPGLKIAADFSEVNAMEVPLPGQWEDNPDKFLLEMAGVNVNHGETDRGS